MWSRVVNRAAHILGGVLSWNVKDPVNLEGNHPGAMMGYLLRYVVSFSVATVGAGADAGRIGGAGDRHFSGRSSAYTALAAIGTLDSSLGGSPPNIPENYNDHALVRLARLLARAIVVRWESIAAFRRQAEWIRDGSLFQKGRTWLEQVRGLVKTVLFPGCNMRVAGDRVFGTAASPTVGLGRLDEASQSVWHHQILSYAIFLLIIIIPILFFFAHRSG